MDLKISNLQNFPKLYPYYIFNYQNYLLIKNFHFSFNTKKIHVLYFRGLVHFHQGN